MHTEDDLVNKLRLIEALFAGAATQGERDAARNARDRICERLREMQRAEPPTEYRFSLPDMWSRRLFLALLRRYDIKPYRYHRQRRTTVMARVPPSFVDETLWPQYERLSTTLHEYLDQVTNRVIHESLAADQSEAEVVEQLSLGS